MKVLHRRIISAALFLFSMRGMFVVSAGAQDLALKAKTLIGDGWHNWYEIKSDPQNSKNLIICGTKLDALRNAFIGFVYASSDGGLTWQSVLEDRNSTWVTEQSCAFGPKHTAYFISEASKVIDGETHHALGTTRLYVSADGGQHWRETLKTAWADHSTSAFNSVSGRLYTFFNSGNSTVEEGNNWGTNIGLLVFSPDGKSVAGPFFNPLTQSLGYHGTYPWGAMALRSGTVVALYHGSAGPPWREVDLAIVRADQSPEPSLESTVISRMVLGKDCIYTDKASLAYDSERNRLFLLYGDGCKNRDVMLTSSDDEGKTWGKSHVLSSAGNPNRVIYSPSLVASPRDVLGLLWRDGESAGRWFFSYIRDQKLVEPPTELSHDPENIQVSNDSLWTWITHADEHHGQAAASEPLITVNVRTALNNVMNVLRVNGAIAAGDNFLVVWPSGSSNGMRLYSGLLSPVRSVGKGVNSTDAKGAGDPDVTRSTVVLYGGLQSFDSETGTLEVCLTLANRGPTPIKVPIKLEAKDVKSPIGAVSIVNSKNGLAGPGAIWDISDSVTGAQIPPRASSKPFCLFFHIDIPRDHVSLEGGDLLNLKLKVLASTRELPEAGNDSTKVP